MNIQQAPQIDPNAKITSVGGADPNAGSPPSVAQPQIQAPNKFLSKQQVADIIKGRPKDVQPDQILKGLAGRGFTLEGYNDSGKNPFDKTVDTNIAATGETEKPSPGILPFVGRFIKGAASTVADIAKLGFNALVHPQKTLESIGDPLVGLVGKFIPGAADEKQTQAANMIGEYYKQRYGGWENVKKTAYEDPFGFALDLTAVLDAGGSLVGKAGDISKLSQLSKAGDLLKAGARATDPFSATAKIAGGAADLAIGGRKLAPFASKLDPGAIAAAERAGVKLPASAVSESRTVALAESIGGKGLFGGKISDVVDEAGNRLLQYADETVKSAGQVSDPSSFGSKILQGYLDYKDTFTKMKNDLYKQVDLKDIQASTPKSISFLDELIAKEKSALTTLGQKTSPELRFYENLKTGLSGNKKGLVRAQDLYNGIDKIQKKISFDQALATGDKAAIRKLSATIGEELDGAIGTAKPEMKAALDKANAYYQQGLDVLESDIGTKIFNLRDQPDKIAEAIMHPGLSGDDIPRLLEIVGKDNIPNLRANLLEKIFTDAKSTATDKIPASGVANQIKKYGTYKLEQILQPEQMQALQDIDKLSKSLQRGSKISQGSQTAFIGKLMAVLSNAFINPLLALKIVVGDFVFSKFISSEAGQRLLQQGYTLPKVGEKIKALGAFGPVLSEVGVGAKTIEAGKE